MTLCVTYQKAIICLALSHLPHVDDNDEMIVGFLVEAGSISGLSYVISTSGQEVVVCVRVHGLAYITLVHRHPDHSHGSQHRSLEHMFRVK